MKKTELLELVQSLPEDGRSYALALWDRDDALHVAANLTAQEADEIIEEMERNYSPLDGLSWDTLAFHVEEFLESRKAPDQMPQTSPH